MTKAYLGPLRRFVSRVHMMFRNFMCNNIYAYERVHLCVILACEHFAFSMFMYGNAMHMQLCCNPVGYIAHVCVLCVSCECSSMHNVCRSTAAYFCKFHVCLCVHLSAHMFTCSAHDVS